MPTRPLARGLARQNRLGPARVLACALDWQSEVAGPNERASERASERAKKH